MCRNLLILSNIASMKNFNNVSQSSPEIISSPVNFEINWKILSANFVLIVTAFPRLLLLSFISYCSIHVLKLFRDHFRIFQSRLQFKKLYQLYFEMPQAISKFTMVNTDITSKEYSELSESPPDYSGKAGMRHLVVKSVLYQS